MILWIFINHRNRLWRTPIKLSCIVSGFIHMKKIRYFLITATLCFSVSSIYGGIFTPASSTIQLPEIINVPAGNIMNGSVLWESPMVKSTLDTISYSVLSGPSSEIWPQIMNATTLDGDIYSTSLRGIGIRWRAIWKARNFPNGKTMSITTTSNNAGATGWLRNDVHEQTIWMQLIKTGAVQSGTFSVSSYSSARFDCNSLCNNWIVKATGSTVVRTGASCRVKTSNIAVNLQRINRSLFNGIGATSAPQPFDLELICTGGEANSTLRPFVTLTDANDAANRSDVLTVTGGAAGIGIQIRSSDKVISYGEDSANFGNPNQWQAGIITPNTSNHVIPLTARYVQTQPSVTTGLANGRATFTLNYQ